MTDGVSEDDVSFKFIAPPIVKGGRDEPTQILRQVSSLDREQRSLNCGPRIPTVLSRNLSSQAPTEVRRDFSGELTLPNDEDSPPERLQLSLLAGIALLVRKRLLLPKLRVRRWPSP